MTKKFWILLSLFLLSLLGSALIILITSRSGIGMKSDSGTYIALAHYFLNGQAQDFSLIRGYITHYPPFFPFVLALCSRLSGLDPAQACRWLNACLFGCNIFLAGLLLERYTKSALISFGGSFVILISIPILLNCSNALSEPMFIFFMLLWLIFLMDFMEFSSKLSFTLCMMTLMAACLTRWAGVTLILTSIVGILFFKKENVKTRCVHAAVLTSVSLLPLLLWMTRNIIFIGIAIDRKLIFHPHALMAYNIFNKFTFISNNNVFFSGVKGLILIAVMFYIGMIIWSKRDKEELAEIPDKVVIFISILFCFCMIYYVALIVTMTFIDNATDTRDRILLPLNISWIMFASLLLHMLLISNKKCEFLKRMFIALCFLLSGTNFLLTIQWASQRYNAGVYFGSIYEDNLKKIVEV